jgi:hypothetical protein
MSSGLAVLPIFAGLSFIVAGGGALHIDRARRARLEEAMARKRGTTELPVYTGFLSGAIHDISWPSTWWFTAWISVYTVLIGFTGVAQLGLLDERVASENRVRLFIMPILGGSSGILMGLGAAANKIGKVVGFMVHWPLAGLFQSLTIVYASSTLVLAAELLGTGALFTLRAVLFGLACASMLATMCLLYPALNAAEELLKVDGTTEDGEVAETAEARADQARAVRASGQETEESEETKKTKKKKKKKKNKAVGGGRDAELAGTLDDAASTGAVERSAALELEANIVRLRRMVFSASAAQMCTGLFLGLTVCTGAAEFIVTT